MGRILRARRQTLGMSQLAVDELEARTVRRIFDLYVHGHDGQPMGMKMIAQHMNEAGALMRGHPWRIQKVSDLLSDRTYRGEYRYNMRDSRTGLLRPESEWVRCPVEPIVDDATFEAARRLREQRDPKADTPIYAKRATIPTLLTGILFCENCGASMTLATGKSGRYKYYKCCSRMSIGTNVCQTPNVPMERMDRLILERLVERVLAPERVMAQLKEWLAEQAKRDTRSEADLQRLAKALRAADDGLNNLYAAIEKGILSLDSSLQARVNHLRDEREKIVSEMALVKRDRPSPRKLSPKQVAYACERMRQMLRDPEAGYGKHLLTCLVSEIRVGTDVVTMTGSTAVLKQAVDEMKLGTSVEVPSIVVNWRARDDSNVRPLPSEGSTLSS